MSKLAIGRIIEYLRLRLVLREDPALSRSGGVQYPSFLCVDVATNWAGRDSHYPKIRFEAW